MSYITYHNDEDKENTKLMTTAPKTVIFGKKIFADTSLQ